MSRTCFVVDDNVNSIELLEQYIRQTPGLELLGSESNALAARELMVSGRIVPDLLFLDVEMPELSGLDLQKQLPAGIRTVFITGFNKYAVEAFEVEAIDYITKPVTYGRFLKTIERALAYFELRDKGASLDSPDAYVEITVDNKRIKLKAADILFMESEDKIVKIYLGNKVYLSNTALKQLEKILPKNLVRVHGSYIVNTLAISSKEPQKVILKNGMEVPVSRNYRKGIL